MQKRQENSKETRRCSGVQNLARTCRVRFPTSKTCIGARLFLSLLAWRGDKREAAGDITVLSSRDTDGVATLCASVTTTGDTLFETQVPALFAKLTTRVLEDGRLFKKIRTATATESRFLSVALEL